MLGPDPISARGAKRPAQERVDPAFRRYLEKEFLGGEVPAPLLAAGGEPDHAPDRVGTTVTRTTAGVWVTVKRVLFRQPKRARFVVAPSRD